MPYYIGDVIKDENSLIARTPEKFREGGIDVRVGVGAEKVDLNSKVVYLSDGKDVPFDVLVLAMGANPITAGIPGEDLDGVFSLKQLPDAMAIKNCIRERKCLKAVIVGAGNIGMEMSEAFRDAGIETVIVNRGSAPVPRWDPELSRLLVDELKAGQLEMRTETSIQAIEKGKDYRLRLITNTGDIEADLILMAIGVRPNVQLARELGLALGSSGAIAVNFSQQTSSPSIYAAGDCSEVFHRVSKTWTHIPLGDVANKQGRVAGRNIAGIPVIFPGVVGAQAFKFFNLEVAAVGLNENEAEKAGFHPVSTLLWDEAVGHSMMETTPLGLKLTADGETGILLGAQAVGSNGAVVRINTLAAALWSGIRLDEVCFLDLAYAPSFGHAWDPIHIAAQILRKKITK